MSIFVIQHISTWWTKASRGAPMASARNAVPIKALVSRPKEKEFSTIIQSVRYNEWEAFIPKERLVIDSVFEPVRCISAERTDDGAWETYWHGGWEGGAPRRIGMRRKLFAERDSWVSMQTNCRTSYEWEGPWIYEKHVVNVGLFSAFDPECFLKSDPVEQFSALGDLW